MIGYGIFEMPWGFLGDRFGVRHTVAAIVLGGSTLTALLVLVAFLPPQRGLDRRLSARGPLPLRRLSSRDIPVDLADDGRLDATRASAARLRERSGCPAGSAGRWHRVLLVWLFAVLGGWKLPLVFLGSLGILWCAFFWPWFRNRPDEMPRVNAPSEI